MGKGTTTQDIMHELMTHGPIAAGMCANRRWAEYNKTKGVLTAEDGLNCTHIDHDVNYIGWGTDDVTGLDFWLIRNSFGTNWGEDGNFRIERGKNAWLIEEHLRAPVPTWTAAV